MNGYIFTLLYFIHYSYGKTISNQEKWLDVTFTDEKGLDRHLREPQFAGVEDLDDGIYQVASHKKILNLNLPINIGFFVYQVYLLSMIFTIVYFSSSNYKCCVCFIHFQYAKLRMLEFYHDFLTVYFSRRDFALIQCDTDS